jgi:hypothetical protein
MSFHPPIPKAKPTAKKPAPKKPSPKAPAKTTAAVKKPC